jgi:predicted phage-related endonuclease
MKTTKAKSKIEMIKKFYELDQEIKELQAMAKTTKAMIKDLLDHESTQAGEYLVLFDERTRKDLNKKALQEYLGEEYDDFIKESSYETMSVKRVG